MFLKIFFDHNILFLILKFDYKILGKMWFGEINSQDWIIKTSKNRNYEAYEINKTYFRIKIIQNENE